MRHRKLSAENQFDVVDPGINLDSYYPSVEWDILRVWASKTDTIYPCCDEPYPDVTFRFIVSDIGCRPALPIIFLYNHDRSERKKNRLISMIHRTLTLPATAWDWGRARPPKTMAGCPDCLLGSAIASPDLLIGVPLLKTLRRAGCPLELSRTLITYINFTARRPLHYKCCQLRYDTIRYDTIR